VKCWHCEEEARAACAFCGRFVCKDHAGTLPSIMAMYLGDQETPKAIVVADAIWCTTCDPQPEPIPMPELF
jgi:hypothetical protein